MKLKGDFQTIIEAIEVSINGFTPEQYIVYMLNGLFGDFDIETDELFGKKVYTALAEHGDILLSDVIEDIARALYGDRKRGISSRVWDAICGLEMVKTENTCPECGWGEIEWETIYGGAEPNCEEIGYHGCCNVFCAAEFDKSI